MAAKKQIQAGNTIEMFGYSWEVLDPQYPGEDGDGLLCLCKEPVEEMPFSVDYSNNYEESDVKPFLEDLTKRLTRQGAEFRTVNLDLTADDGTGWNLDPLPVKGAFLLTDTMYRKYRRYITNKEECWWTATAYSFNEIYYDKVVTINTEGSCENENASGEFKDIWVVPACVFTSTLEDKIKNLEEENKNLKEQIARLEKQLNDREKDTE